MVIYTFRDIAAIFGYGFLAGFATPIIAVLVAGSLGRGQRGK